MDADGWWDVSEREYHACFERVSHHMLEVFRESIPRYHALYVGRTLAQPEPTPAMVLGAALHCGILEPLTFWGRYMPAPDVDRRTKEGKARWERCIAEAKAGGTTPITAADFALVDAMTIGCNRNPEALRIIDAPGRCEAAIRWTWQGVPMRSRLDKVTTSGLVVDMKTVAGSVSPAAWAAQVYRYGYHRQAALYLDAAASMGVDGTFAWVVVSKEPPHECAVYTPDARTLDIGRGENARDLAELAGRMERADWASRWAGIQKMELPAWVRDPVPY